MLLELAWYPLAAVTVFLDWLRALVWDLVLLLIWGEVRI